jgi:hypothetical protein
VRHADQRGLVSVLVGDGTPLLTLMSVALVLCGGFALFLSAEKQFLPHDMDFLQMTAEQLCGMNQCKIVHFMFHDRVSFGGALIAIGTLYLWLIMFPLRSGEGWAWWLLLVSGIAGFGSFLAYLGYGYLDTWHGVATLFLLPCMAIGLALSYPTLKSGKSIRSLFTPWAPMRCRELYGAGRYCLAGVGVGMIAGGLTIMFVGMTSVFVSTDLDFLGMGAAQVAAVNRHLVPLIAHDRAGFGGAVATCGIIFLFSVVCGQPSRSLWEALAIAGAVGFVTTIGVHPIIGYTNAFHLGPALIGCVAFVAGMICLKRPMFNGLTRHAADTEKPGTTAQVV